jgi:hypothetical protein
MAINQSRDMTTELHQGIIDGSYMSITPDWGGAPVNPEWERMAWPTYQQVEQHRDDPFDEHPLYCGCHHEVATRGTATTFDKYRNSAAAGSPRFQG